MHQIGSLRKLGVPAAILMVGVLAGCSAKSPEELLAEAQSAMTREDYASANIQLKNALQQSPDFALARLELGRILVRQQDFLSAEKELNKALELGASADEVVPLLAQVLTESGRYADVVSRFSSMKLISPVARAKLDVYLGQAASAANDKATAERLFASALSENPKDAGALVGKARLLMRDRNIDAASDLIHPLLEDNASSQDVWVLQADILAAKGDRQGAIDALRKAVASRPGQLRVRARLVAALVDTGKYDEARTEIAALRKVAPSALEPDYLTALLLVREGKFSEARPRVEKVLAKAPDFMPAVWLGAQVSYQLKSFAQAEQHVEKLIAKGANSIAVRKIQIGSYLGTGRTARAQQAIQPLLRQSPNDPEILALAGQVLLAAGDTEAAVRSLEMSAEVRPDDAHAQSRLGLVKLAAGDYEGGIGALQNAAKLDHDGDSRPEMLMVLAHLRQRNGDAALAALSALEKKRPDDPMVYNLRGAAYLLKRDSAAARAAFENALKIQPQFFPAASNLARLDIAEGKLADATKRFYAVLERDSSHADALIALAGLKAQTRESRPEAEKLLLRAVKSHPDLLKSHLSLVQFYAVTDNRKAALEAAQSAIKANPDNAAAYDLLANVQASQGDHLSAVATRLKAVERAPGDAGAWANLGGSQAAAGQNSEAEQSYRKALQLKPESPDVEVMLASLYRGQKKFDDALQIGRKLQKAYPKSPVGFMVEGEVMVSAAKTSGAIAAFREAHAREPSAQTLIRLVSAYDLDKQEGMARKVANEWMQKHPDDTAVLMYEAGAAMARRQFDHALTHYKRVLAQSPENFLALNNVAWLLWRNKDIAAREFAERAHRVAPDNPAILDTYGVILAETGKLKEGIAMLKRAVEKSPKSESITLNYARALVADKQKAEARPYLEKLAALGKSFPGSSEAADLLKAL